MRKLVPGLFFFLLGAAVEHLIPGSESSTLWHYVELAAFALSYIFVGFSILREAVEGVLAKNIFNENLLMAVASLGAFAIGEYSEGCAVVLLYTVGEFLQSLAVQKSRRSIKGMLEQKPDTVRVQAKDGLTEAEPETVQPGQTIVVEPGRRSTWTVRCWRAMQRWTPPPLPARASRYPLPRVWRCWPAA